MIPKKNLVINIISLIVEVVLITYLNYRVAGSFYSLDVLYCLPIIQAARIGAVRAARRSDTRTPLLTGIICAFVWSAAEVAVVWPTFPLGAFLINVVTRTVTLTIIGRVVSNLWKEREYSRKDSLTELANRVEFVERFEFEQVRSTRSGKPYSLLYIDIDQFKTLNDNHGHHVGDDALKVVAELLVKGSRVVDTVARIGGDEFVVLFPETDAQDCQVLVNRIVLDSEKKFDQLGWPIALSIGHVTEIGKNKSAEDVLRRADERMYQNKKAKQ